MASRRPQKFRLPEGYILAEKYRVEEPVGNGWEGEVYRVTECRTGVTRAAKVFYPERNPGNRTVKRYARILERLRHCPIVTQYHHSEVVRIDERRVTCLISEYAPGVVLADLSRGRRGRRLELFEAMHLLHALAAGLEAIHQAGLYHGDLHEWNVLVRRRGVRMEIKVLDFFHRGRCTRHEQQGDVIDAIRLFYDILGGAARYAAQPPEVKRICCGLKHGLIRKRYPSATRLRQHLETFDW